MGTLILKDEHQRKSAVLARMSSGVMTTVEGAAHLNVTVRHAKRMLARYRLEGAASVVHGNQGRAPKCKTASEIVDRILELALSQDHYAALNTVHMHELLLEEQGIDIGRSTLDRLLRARDPARAVRAGSNRAARKWRERRAAEGMMLQIDGSTHKWLGENSPKSCLLGAVDDATSGIVELLFRPTEDQVGYLTMMRSIAVRRGLPMSYYHDKHTILRSPKQAMIDEQLDGNSPMSQIQNVLHLCGTHDISANSPQAKGRIERLWGTLQDRLIKEMAMRKIETLEEANAFLPNFIKRYNKTHAKEPADPVAAWVALEPKTDVDYLFSTREPRLVNNDHTVKWNKKLLQLLPSPKTSSLVAKYVNVHTTPEGETLIYFGTERLPFKEIQKRSEPPASTPRRPKIETAVNADAVFRKNAWLYGKRIIP